MKATELMIGDWVYRPDCEDRVTRILGHSIYGLDRLRGIICEEELKPISLTAEILEKNGWKESQFWHEYQDGKNTLQSCPPDMRGIINGVEIQHFNCECVHQYQHLLRLCGLTELADNFKI